MVYLAAYLADPELSVTFRAIPPCSHNTILMQKASLVMPPTFIPDRHLVVA